MSTTKLIFAICIALLLLVLPVSAITKTSLTELDLSQNMPAALKMGTNKITGLGSPADGHDAAIFAAVAGANATELAEHYAVAHGMGVINNTKLSKAGAVTVGASNCDYTTLADAIAANPAHIIISSGTFTLPASAIAFKSDTIIEGQGNTTVLKAPNSYKGYPFYTLNVHDVTLKNFVVDGNKDNRLSGAGNASILFNGGFRIYIENVVIRNSPWVALYLGYLEDSRVINCYLENTTSDGIYLTNVHNSTFSKNHIRNVVDTGIANCNSNNNLIEGNWLYNIDQGAIDLAGARNCKVVDNHIRKCDKGVYVGYPGVTAIRCLVEGNDISLFKLHGIDIYDASGDGGSKPLENIITHNEIYEPLGVAAGGTFCILNMGTGSIITDNNCRGPIGLSAALHMLYNSGANNCTVSGNTINGVAPANTDGIVFAGNSVGFVAMGNKVFNVASGGFDIASGSNGFTVMGNVLRNTAGFVDNSGSVTKDVAHWGVAYP